MYETSGCAFQDTCFRRNRDSLALKQGEKAYTLHNRHSYWYVHDY